MALEMIYCEIYPALNFFLTSNNVKFREVKIINKLDKSETDPD